MDDKEDVYDAEFAPLVARLIELAKQHEMPMFATFGYAPDSWCTTAIPQDGDGGVVDDLRRRVYRPTAFAAVVITTEGK